MKRCDVEAAFQYFNNEVKKADEDFPHYFRAFQACAKKLDEMDMEERKRMRAIAFFAEEIERLYRAPEVNKCDMTPVWAQRIKMCEVAIAILEECKNE